jgi:ankyrin repeat protein
MAPVVCYAPPTANRAGWVEGVKLLLAGGAAAGDTPNKQGLSALGEAVAAGQLAAAQALLDAGASPTWRAPDGCVCAGVRAWGRRS